jgi:phenylalanyl-tRNA synthetase alpha subunit
MGDKVAGGPLGKYGMNVGPMAITWVMRFVYGKVESYTGSALSRAFQSKKKEARQWESEEERAARKATRKAARKAAREEAELKQREKEEAETKRRKEAADKATEELFGPSKQGTPPPSNDTQEKARKEFQEQMMENLDMDELD